MNSPHSPPQWATALLRWFCKPDLLEMIEGDLNEKFNGAESTNQQSARLEYAFEILRLFRPPIVRNNLISDSLVPNNMWKNHLTVARRNLSKHMIYSMINLGGLALGIVCFLLLTAYIKHERSFDNFHDNGESIYQLYMDATFDGTQDIHAVTPTALVPSSIRSIADIKTGVRVYRPGTFFPQLVRRGDVVFDETDILYVDSTFFDVFSFNLLQGSQSTALTQPRSVVLSETAADKYFGSRQVLGKEIELRGSPFTVTGVIEDAPANTSLNYFMLASFSSLPQSTEEIWWSANYSSYIVVQPNTNLATLEARIDELVSANISDDLDGTDQLFYKLLPLNKVHLGAPFIHDLRAQGSTSTLRVLIAIGLFILLIACINYTNIATARSTNRSREVGMRKVLGAYQSSIFKQFMTEAAMLTFGAIVIGVGLMFLVYSQFEALAGQDIAQPLTQDRSYYWYLLALGAAVTLFAGIYPGVVLAKFKPTAVLKGSGSRLASGQALRKALVVSQFGISTLLVFSTITVTRQLDFLENSPIGYSMDQVITVPITRQISENLGTFKQEISRIPGVVSLGSATNPPNNIMGGYSLEVEGVTRDNDLDITAAAIDDSFIETMGIKLLSGRSVTPDELERARIQNENGDRPTAIVVNSMTVRALGETNESIIGKTANINGRVGPIVGVIDDFHFRSLHETVGPLALFAQPGQLWHMAIRLDAESIQTSIGQIENVWPKFEESRPFVFGFLDESYATMYENEQRLSLIIRIFACIAIFIACLGLFGLTSLTVIQRSKEIAVRKVLGASGRQLIFMVSRNFIVLICIALCLALPISFYVTNQWLHSFAYRIYPGIGIAAVSILAVVGLGLLTVGIETLKSAMADPVMKLRSE